MNLEITNRIIACDKYLHELKLLAELEHDRIFCGHDIEHFLNVARITMIMCCENSICIDPDIVYSAALLHDIGRTDEYISGVPHDEAGIRKAEVILKEVGCNEEMKEKILSLIGSHRNKSGGDCSLEKIFYRADKKSRLCFCCPAQEDCNWSEEKRNMKIEV